MNNWALLVWDIFYVIWYSRAPLQAKMQKRCRSWIWNTMFCAKNRDISYRGSSRFFLLFKKACKTRSLAFKSGLRLMIGPSVHAYFEVTNLFYIQAAFSLNWNKQHKVRIKPFVWDSHVKWKKKNIASLTNHSLICCYNENDLFNFNENACVYV